ncbi:MAG: response regulator transcription factor [Puniceicoccales bacterium]|jgi:DNA-binding response OmpR family regulator|nr:response regulator transcription factor [Puniceicoccales bacterium]
MRARILIAEDDTNIRLGLMATLESEGLTVVAAADGAQALKLFAQEKFDLVILDVMMPKQSGYDVCRSIRQRDARVPVLFLTAKSEEIDKVLGLKLGADDYMTKPFGVLELLARVDALLRRARVSDADGTDAAGALPEVFAFGGAVIDRKRFTATLDGAKTALTVRELKLLEVLAAHPNTVLTRDALLNAAWGVAYSGTTRTLDQHVAQLRKKVERRPDAPEVILTAHGIGYRYEAAK